MIKRKDCMVQDMKGRRKTLAGVLAALAVFLTAGCSIVREDKEKIADLEYTLVKEEELPDELQEEIAGRKEEPMKISYGDGEDLYIVRGYGEKETDGYEAEVLQLYETKNAVYIQTSLAGPPSEADAVKEKTYPYVAVKTAYNAKRVLFDE